jgi:hypothetical protein
MGSPAWIWYQLLALWFVVTVVWFIFQPVVQGIMDGIAPYCTNSESLTVLSGVRFTWNAVPILVVVFSLIWVFTHAQKPSWESEREYYG